MRYGMASRDHGHGRGNAATDYTLRHYNNHTVERVDVNKRRQGLAFPLKDFHNQIKRDLIRSFASGRARRLLDLGCGRGGDIRKWLEETHLEYVKGLDLSGPEVEEARRRFHDISQSSKHSRLEAEFQQWGKLGVEPLPPDSRGPYDAVTCMFAAHYFFQTQESAKMFMQNVSASLRMGGVFFGCVPDGKEVLKLLHGQDTYKSAALTIRKKWRGEQKCFGSAFTVAISDTVTDATGEGDEGSYEYLVFFNVFKAIAAEYNLYPKTTYSPTINRHFKPEDANEPFKHFNPNFANAPPGLSEASGINVAFCFEKLPAPPQHRPTQTQTLTQHPPQNPQHQLPTQSQTQPRPLMQTQTQTRLPPPPRPGPPRPIELRQPPREQDVGDNNLKRRATEPPEDKQQTKERKLSM